MPTINTEKWKELLTNLKNNMYNTVTEDQRRHQIYALSGVLIASGMVIAAPVIVPILVSGTGLVIINDYSNRFASVH